MSSEAVTAAQRRLNRVPVPTGWKIIHLGDVFEPVVDTGHKLDLPVLSVTVGGRIVRRSSLDRRSDREVAREKYLRVLPGDIAYNTMRMWQGASGLVGEEGYISPAYTVCRPRPDESPEFWATDFQNSAMIRAFRDHSQGFAKDRYRLYYHHFATVPALRPPLSEQRKIAAILSSVDQAIEKTEAVIELLQVAKGSMIREFLERGLPNAHSSFKISRIGTLPESWEVVSLGECVEADRPICYGILKPGRSWPGGVPVVKVKNIKFGRILEADLLLTSPDLDEQYKRSRLRERDILLTIRGTTGRLARVPASLEGANITQDSARISIRTGISSSFVYYALQGEPLQKQIADHTRGQAVKGINIRDVRRLMLPFPPLWEQEKIADALELREIYHEAARQSLQAQKALKSALLQSLLSGEIRVSPTESAT